MTGRVYLVGSGPDDPELLTVKARRLVDEATAQEYINRRLVELARGGEQVVPGVTSAVAAGVEPPAVTVIGRVAATRERVEAFVDHDT
jgi:siroheme synthase